MGFWLRVWQEVEDREAESNADGVIPSSKVTGPSKSPAVSPCRLGATTVISLTDFYRISLTEQEDSGGREMEVPIFLKISSFPSGYSWLSLFGSGNSVTAKEPGFSSL